MGESLMSGHEQVESLPVVVIGAGPVGLAAAAHLAERGVAFTVLESGTEAGSAVRSWGHVRVFSPWRYNIDAAARRLLEAAGWSAPDAEELPTGHELVDAYLAPLAKHPAIAPHVRYGQSVTAVSRLGFDRVRTVRRDQAPFVLRVANGEGEVRLRARAVIDASGTWLSPNVLGGDGMQAVGEAEARAAGVVSSALPDVLGAERGEFAGRRVLVAGAGHSATNTLLNLAQLAEQEPGTQVLWAIRGQVGQRVFGGGVADELPARGALGSRLKELVDSGRVELLTGFSIEAVEQGEGGVQVTAADGRTVSVDRIVSATGFRPDHTVSSELRVDWDPVLGATRALAPLIDPNEHSCGTVPPHGQEELAHPEAGYYAVGMKSYGRAPTFLMATGYEQVRSIAAYLDGDLQAAAEVHLELPETGVCSANPDESAGGSSCCGPAPVALSIWRGLGTGVSGGLLSAPLQLIETGDGGPGCC
ncbi:FAD-dependent oxidoreductase [Actinospica sp. MGRD01-02]|uniref:FAD-dependent oxidoreductase n=1 Tax=Actinospica acidithermotolerans TaxID=2828514 RepID=A0A941IIU1_9ACTN|nr:FAD-dependent oxidoreductase [Actinospica acidithermotolerans]MBR7828704.1 FAD-dependent oxidoreductase [Actinospica acidithermotolerans]